MSKGCRMRWNLKGDLVYHEEGGKVLYSRSNSEGAKAYNIISDDLGIKGVYSHADGKKYDSKSAYYKAVKAQGLRILEKGDNPAEKKPAVPEIDWHRAVAETLERKGY